MEQDERRQPRRTPHSKPVLSNQKSKLIYTSMQMEDDELLMKLCTDGINLSLLCVGFLKQSGSSYASNEMSCARAA